MKNSYDDIDKILWGLFSQTGNIGYYFLYNKTVKKEMKNKDKKD